MNGRRQNWIVATGIVGAVVGVFTIVAVLNGVVQRYIDERVAIQVAPLLLVSCQNNRLLLDFLHKKHQADEVRVQPVCLRLERGDPTPIPSVITFRMVQNP
jgi:hypothetical protein